MPRCIICDKELKEIVCRGMIKDLEVSLCHDHASFCDGCDSVRCSAVEG